MLRDYLVADEADPKSANDFGKNIIPAMLRDGRGMYAYDFSGYWKDVGTIYSLWEANMDILDENSGINLSDPEWKIYARNVGQPPHYIGKDATVKGSIISEGGIVDGTVTKSIIFQKVSVGQGAVIENSVIFPGTVVGDGAVVKYSRIPSSERVRPSAVSL